MEPYKINVDVGKRHLSIVQNGFWDEAIFDAFAGELIQAYHQLHRYGGCETALVDARNYAVQSREITEKFGLLLSKLTPFRAKRRATVVTAQLNWMQANRSEKALENQIFTDPAEAFRWLFNEPVTGANSELMGGKAHSVGLATHGSRLQSVEARPL